MKLAALGAVLALALTACAGSVGVDGELYGDAVQVPPSSEAAPSSQEVSAEPSTDSTSSLDPVAPRSGSGPTTTVQKPYYPPTSPPPLVTGTTAAASGEDVLVSKAIEIPPALNPIVLLAVADLAERIGLSIESISVVRAEFVTWPDSSLGCPQPDMMYTQVLTDGVLVVLLANGMSYEYHAGSQGDPFWCPVPTPPSSSGYGDK